MIKFHTARTLTVAIMLLALTMSFVHISTAAALLGAGWDRWTAPFLIDTVAIIGKIASGEEFTAATRRAGRKALRVAGTISLAANVGVGFAERQYGSAILGAIVVSVALWGESMISHLRPTAKTKNAGKASKASTPAPAKTNKDARTPEQTKRSEAARKAAATRAARKAQATADALVAPVAPALDALADSRAYI